MKRFALIIVGTLLSSTFFAQVDSFVVNRLTFKIVPLNNWHINAIEDGWSSDTTWNVQYNYDIDKQELGANIYIQLIERDSAVPQIDDRNIGSFDNYNLRGAHNNNWNGYRVSYKGKKNRKCSRCGLFYRIFYIYTLSDKHNLCFTFYGHGSSENIDSLVLQFESVIQPFFDNNNESLSRFLLFREPVNHFVDSLQDPSGNFLFYYNPLYRVSEPNSTTHSVKIKQISYLHSPFELSINRRGLETLDDRSTVNKHSLYRPLYLSTPHDAQMTYVLVSPINGASSWIGYCSRNALPFGVNEAELEVYIARRYFDKYGNICEFNFSIKVKVLDGSLNMYYLTVLNEYVTQFEGLNELRAAF